MNGSVLSNVMQALELAVFQRDQHGQLRLVAPAPDWVATLWPDVTGPDSMLHPETSPFLENFLIDAAAGWQEGTGRVSSGPWLESDASGGDHHLQATALRAGSRAVLVIERLGSAYEERTSIVQKAHEAALAYERLERAEQALAEQKRLLEERVRERTAELSQTNAALREEIALRRRYAERLESMREIDKAILAAQSPKAIAEAALRRLYPLLPCEHACVLELDPASGCATVLARVDRGQLTGAGGEQLSSEQLEMAGVLKSAQLLRIANGPNLFDLRGHDSAGSRLWPLILDVPLIAEETVVGVLNLATQSAAAVTQEHEEIAQAVAAQLAVAIRQAQLFAQISAGRKRLRALSLRLVETQEAERRFMAHELHDEIGQILTGLKLTLKTPVQPVPEQPAGGRAEAIAMVDELLNRVRQLSLDLRPQVLDDLGLMPALDWLFKRYLQQTGIRVQFKHTPLSGRMPAQLETAVFRIVQEALTNVARHAGVKAATVRLWSNGDSLGVQVEDRGAGFDFEQAMAGRDSSGLAGMRERALMLGGEFTLDSRPGAGTRLTVELPLNLAAVPGPALEASP